MKTRKDLRPQQLEAVEYVKQKEKCALFLGMGMGKTTITLTAIVDMFAELSVKRVLIIAPKRVAESVWHKEIEQWEHLKHLKYAICTGSEASRIKALKSESDIHIINRELIPWLIDRVSIYKWRWDMVVIDESSSFKNHDTERFKKLRHVLKYLKSIVLLTGTPAPRGEANLWSQIFLLDNGQRLGRNITMFRNTFMTKSYNGFSYELLPGASERIKQLISDICLTMDTEDSVQLTGETIIDHHLEMPKKSLDIYLTLEREFFVELQKDQNVETPSKAAMRNKLLQICNGAIYYDKQKNWQELHGVKIQALKEIMEDNPNENFLVAYSFESDLERLKKAFPEARTVDSDKDVDDWNAGKIKILLAHPASCGHGLNLQFGGCNAVWFGLNWSLELYMQFNARLNRSGQKKPVNIIRLIIKDSIDEDVVEVLKSRFKTQKEILDYLKKKLVDKYSDK